MEVDIQIINICILKFTPSFPKIFPIHKIEALKFLLDVALLNPLLIQVLDKLLPLHPVDEWTDISAVSKERSARQVNWTSCGRQEKESPDKNVTNVSPEILMTVEGPRQCPLNK